MSPVLAAQRRLLAAFALLAVTSAACNVGPHDDDVVTWADVRPLLERSCLECHASTFGTYEGARESAHAMLAMVEAQLMPPGGIDRSGACNEYEGPRPMNDDDIATLRAWIDDNMPHEAAPATRLVHEERRGREVSATFTVDAAPDDVQRCTIVDIGAQDAFLVGVSMDAPRAVHHAMVFTISESNADDASPWLCDGVPRGPNGETAQLAFAWTPGRAIVSFPDETGVALSSRLIVQWHEYGPLDDDAESATAQLTLHIADEVARPLAIVPVALAGFSLAPGDDVALERPVSLPSGDVIGVMPHLHVAGRSLRLSTSDQCIVSAPRYDFAFQEVAFFTEALRIDDGATGTLTCTWDTRDRSTATRWGEGSVDEMCTAFLFVAR